MSARSKLAIVVLLVGGVAFFVLSDRRLPLNGERNGRPAKIATNIVNNSPLPSTAQQAKSGGSTEILVDRILNKALSDAESTHSALTELKRILADNPDNIFAHHASVYLLNRLGSSQDAIDHVNQILERIPNHVGAIRARSELRRNLGDTVGAAEDERLGNELSEQKAKDELLTLEYMLKKHPNHPTLLARLGQYHLSNRNYASAISAYDTVFATAPQHALTPADYHHKATALIGAGRTDEALAVYDQSIDIFPENPQLIRERTKLRATIPNTEN